MSNAAVFAFLTLLYSCRVSSGNDELSRNYASNECGAKIIAANPEAEGTFKILSDARDEYMLNPCKAKIWFVVELCEPIQPSAIELANFELYSSTPKEIQIEGSDKYPSQEWSQLGSFEASESRELQRFQIKSQSQYMKFIRISLHSHYGSEHYCPVSLIRAFGISLAEEFDTIESGGAVAPVSPGITSPFVQTVVQQQVQPQPLQPHQPPPDQVLSNESVDDLTASSVKITGASDVPLSDLLSNKASGPDERPADPDATDTVTNSIQLTDPDRGCQESDILLMGDKIESSCQASGARGGTAPLNVPDPAPSPTPTVDAPAAAAIDGILSPTPVLIEVAEINSRITSTSTGAASIVADITELPTPGHESLSSSGADAISVTVGQETVSASGTDVVAPSDQPVTSMPVVSPSPPESAAEVQNSLPPQASPEPVGAVVPPPPSPPPVLQGPAHVMNESSTGSVIAASSSKESIFIRLNNRIKALELNMSLNREAIESIVRKQDMFEHRINDLMNRTQVQEEEGQKLIIDLQLKLNDISEQVYLLVSEKEVFHWQLIQVHILLMVIEIAIIIMIMNTFMKKILSAAAIPQQASCHHVDHRENEDSNVNDAGSSSCVTPTKAISPSRSLIRSFSRTSPDKSSLFTDHHPITGAALLKKKRKKKKKKKLNQENVPPPPPSPVVAEADHQPNLHQPHVNPEPQLLVNGKIADIG